MSFTHDFAMSVMLGYGMGPGIGDVFFLVGAKASTNAYYMLLNSQGVGDDHIFTDPTTAHAAMTAERNDVLIVTPAEYTLTSGVTWSKTRCHIACAGGPNLRVQPSTLTTGGLRFKTVTAAVSYLFEFSGNYCESYGLATFNNGAATSNLGDIGIIGKNNYVKKCDFRGGNNATQNTATTPYAGVPVVFEAGTNYGNGTTFEECQIGSAGNAVRTHGAGAVLFLGGGAFDTTFKNSRLEMWTETSGSDVALVKLNAASQSADRLMEFDGCTLYNFWTNLASKMSYAVVDGAGTTHNISFKNCSVIGITALSNVATYTFTNIADAGTHGGIGAAVATS